MNSVFEDISSRKFWIDNTAIEKKKLTLSWFTIATQKKPIIDDN
jgi:hypothetical protein